MGNYNACPVIDESTKFIARLANNSTSPSKNYTFGGVKDGTNNFSKFIIIFNIDSTGPNVVFKFSSPFHLGIIDSLTSSGSSRYKLEKVIGPFNIAEIKNGINYEYNNLPSNSKIDLKIEYLLLK
jgi:hypothetical protein